MAVSLNPPSFCAVCQEDILDGSVPLDLACSHKYHEVCLLPWIYVEQKDWCPLCKTKITSINDKEVEIEVPKPDVSEPFETTFDAIADFALSILSPRSWDVD